MVGGKGLTSCEKLDTADNRREVAGAEVSTAPPSATWGHSLLVGRAAANTCCSICCRTVMGTETPRHKTHMMSTTGSVLLLEVDEASQSGSECRALARGDVRLICLCLAQAHARAVAERVVAYQQAEMDAKQASEDAQDALPALKEAEVKALRVADEKQEAGMAGTIELEKSQKYADKARKASRVRLEMQQKIKVLKAEAISSEKARDREETTAAQVRPQGKASFLGPKTVLFLL